LAGSLIISQPLSWGLRPRAGSPAEQLGWGARLYAAVRSADLFPLHWTLCCSEGCALLPPLLATAYVTRRRAPDFENLDQQQPRDEPTDMRRVGNAALLR